MSYNQPIKTGFYSDYALKFFNDFMSEVQRKYLTISKTDAKYDCNVQGTFRYVNRLFEIPTYSVERALDYIERYMFKHGSDGEIELEDLPCKIEDTRTHHYWHFGQYTNQQHLYRIAICLKLLTANKTNSKVFDRHDFANKIDIGGSKYSVAELHFIYDKLLNNCKSIRSFKTRNPELYSTIVGVQRDPIQTEFAETVKVKKDELKREYLKEFNKAIFPLYDCIKGNMYTETDKLFVAEIMPIMTKFCNASDAAKQAAKDKYRKAIAELDNSLEKILC